MIYNRYHNIFSDKIYSDDEELSKLKFFMKRFILANKAYWNMLEGYGIRVQYCQFHQLQTTLGIDEECPVTY